MSSIGIHLKVNAKASVFIVLILGLFLSACSATPVAPLTSVQSKKILSEIKTPDSIVKMKKEDFILEEGDEESDSFDPSYETSETCTTVGEADQLIYQSNWGTANKQSLAPLLRKFNAREGIKFIAETPESADSYEYVTLYVSIISYSSEQEANDFMASIRDNVESCGDLKGEYQTLTLTNFKIIDEALGDFSMERFDYLDFSEVIDDLEISSTEQVSFWNLGSNVIGIQAAISDGGSSTVGLSMSQLEVAAAEIVEQIRVAAKNVKDLEQGASTDEVAS